MSIKLVKSDRTKSEFRNELISFTDAKLIDIEKTMVNLFMLLKHNGAKARIRVKGDGKSFSVDDLVNRFKNIESDKGIISGASKNEKALLWWLRSNLVEMVFRGNPEKEKTSSLKPIHLQSFVIRNPKHTRDYFSSEQVYSMLSVDPNVLEELKIFLNHGWDQPTKTIAVSEKIDIDSLGILRLIEFDHKDASDDTERKFDKIRPLLFNDAKNFCDDIHKLLQYKNEIPRHVLIEYLKTITSFHLSLYTIKLIKIFPVMVQRGTKDISTKIDLVIDMTDDPDSHTSFLSMSDAQSVYDNILDYIKSVFMINTALSFLRLGTNDSANLDKAMNELIHPSEKFQAYCMAQLEYVKAPTDEDKKLIEDITNFEEDDLNKFIAVVMKARGAFHYKYHVQLLDSLMMKNLETGMLAQGRSRKHKRRFIIGTKLLETLVQIRVLTIKDSKYTTEPVSIEEFMSWLSDRYGLIINGIDNPRFIDDNIKRHKAFKVNLESFKNKLRQIGFYDVLSDAYVLQKIRPRYEINQ